MISFNNLNYMGRLGNQMFQYAGLRGLAAHKGYQYSLPISDFDLINCFKIPSTPQNNNTHTVYADKFEFSLDFFNNCPDNVDVHCFFASEKYFKHIENEIRNDFTFKDKIQEKSIKYYRDLEINESLAIHIRRGDYLENTTRFVNLSLDYYSNALDFFDKKIPVIIFSDDPEWCSKQDLFKNKRFIISNLKDGFADLSLMSMCDYHIIANSSYSWWGSWLAKSKKVIAPNQWFTGEYAHLNTKDLYLSTWIVI